MESGIGNLELGAYFAIPFVISEAYKDKILNCKREGVCFVSMKGFPPLAQFQIPNPQFPITMKRVVLLNILFFFLLMCVFLAAAFGMGYATNNRFGTDAGILYLLIVVVHLFLNYMVMHKNGFPVKKIWYANAAIGAVYLLIIFH